MSLIGIWLRLRQTPLHGEPGVVIPIETSTHTFIILVIVDLIDLLIDRIIFDRAVPVQCGQVLWYLRLAHLLLINLQCLSLCFGT